MRKYMVDLAFVTDSLDLNEVIDGLKQHLETTLDASVLINLRVYRARTTGQTCAMVGDGHVSKIAEDEAVEV